MTIVEAAEVRQRLTMPVCIDLMRTSLRELEAGNYTQPLRSIALLPGGEKFGFMPACLGDCFGAKVLSAFPQNAGTKYPSHIGYVLLFEGEHGSFLGMADAAVITEIRTGGLRLCHRPAGPARCPPPSHYRGGSTRTVSLGRHDRCAGYPFRDRL